MQAKQKKFEMCTTENTQYDSEHRSTHITIIIVIGVCMCVYVCVCVFVCVTACVVTLAHSVDTETAHLQVPLRK